MAVLTSIWTIWRLVMIAAMPRGTWILSSKNQNMNCMFWGVGGPECFEGVVGVHDWVDHVVHHHEPPNIGGEVAKAVEDGYEDAKVVVPAFKQHWKVKREMYKNQDVLITSGGRWVSVSWARWRRCLRARPASTRWTARSRRLIPWYFGFRKGLKGSMGDLRATMNVTVFDFWYTLWKIQIQIQIETVF